MSNKWWYKRPCNSDRTSNLLSLNWSNYVNDIYDKKNIYHGIMNMVDNHFRNVYTPYILKHVGKAFLLRHNDVINDVTMSHNTSHVTR